MLSAVALQQPIAYEEIEQAYISLVGEVPLGGLKTYANIPVGIHEEVLPAVQECVAVLEKAIEQVVHHYATDTRIQRIYGLEKNLEDVLALAADIPYCVGAFRPDFLIADNGQWKLCEIGARFPLNGWMISYYTGQVMAQLNVDKEACTSTILCDIPDVFANLFDAEQPLVLVLDNEAGSEVHWLLEVFCQKGVAVHIARPNELSMRDGMCVLHDGIPVQQCILEMDRSELQKFSPDVLRHIVQNCVYINDVRTLILVHDKRILAVLYDESIMRDYLSEEEYALLQPYLIPSFSLYSNTARERHAAEQAGWVLKQSSGGRGEGMFVGHECLGRLWQEIVTYCWRDYMVQQYVPQRAYHLPTETGSETVHIVGMLLCLHTMFCGIGICRGSSHEIINVHRGRGRIFPTVLYAE